MFDWVLNTSLKCTKREKKKKKKKKTGYSWSFHLREESGQQTQSIFNHVRGYRPVNLCKRAPLLLVPPTHNKQSKESLLIVTYSQSLISSKRNDSRDFGIITLIPHNHCSFGKQMAGQVYRTFDYFTSDHRNVCNLSNFLQVGVFDSKFYNFQACLQRFQEFHIATR